jgi:hypothetical protein
VVILASPNTRGSLRTLDCSAGKKKACKPCLIINAGFSTHLGWVGRDRPRRFETRGDITMNTKADVVAKTLRLAVGAAALGVMLVGNAGPALAAGHARQHTAVHAPLHRGEAASETPWYGNPDREWHGPNSQMND